MLKGALSLLLLELLAGREDYGYSLVARLRDAGFADLTEGTVYPALSRLRGAGLLDSRLVRSSSGPARTYYVVTAAGESERRRGRVAWATLVDSVSRVLEPEGAAS